MPEGNGKGRNRFMMMIMTMAASEGSTFERKVKHRWPTDPSRFMLTQLVAFQGGFATGYGAGVKVAELDVNFEFCHR
jgi:hypothetical protein